MHSKINLIETDFVSWNTFQCCIVKVLLTPIYISVSFSQQNLLILSNRNQNASLMRIKSQVRKQIHATSETSRLGQSCTLFSVLNSLYLPLLNRDAFNLS